MSLPETTACAESTELLLRALHEPAVEVRGPSGRAVWTRADRLRLTWVMEALEKALGTLLEAEVRLELGGSARPTGVPMRQQAFGWRFRIGAADQPERFAFLTIDTEAGRLLADKLEQRVVGLRGVGELTDTELGLVEFVGLECLHQVAGQCDGPLPFQLVAPVPKAELTSTLANPELTPVAIGLSIHGRSGSALLWLPARSGRPCLQLAEPQLPAGPRPGLWCSLALPAIALGAGEAEQLRPGDVILLGCAELGGFAQELDLVTSTGWRLATASLIEDGPSSVAVQLGKLEPSVQLLPEPRPGGSVLVPTMAWVALSRENLADWKVGAHLSLRKEESAAVRLHREEGEPLPGELVAVGHEMGVRVLS